jgi:hypothetical protein
MTTLTDAAQASQDQILSTVRQSQQAVVDAVAAWAKAVENVVPPLPAIPGAEELPKPEAVVDNAFDFAQKLLDAQRDFARSVISAAAPVLEKAAEGDKPA